jgi:hypothetical protein
MSARASRYDGTGAADIARALGCRSRPDAHGNFMCRCPGPLHRNGDIGFCIIDGCDDVAVARGLCHRHSRKQRRRSVGEETTMNTMDFKTLKWIELNGYALPPDVKTRVF